MGYRLDIDGLRAIAVCIVICFHFTVPGFTGGFIGVDVFFVLSGYLIGSIIINQMDNNRFSFVHFYFRRIRRLFPAFVAVIVVTTIAAYLLMLPPDFREFGQSVIASSVYLSNILFYWEAGYFDTASHLKPLLHTWSLSVEEQFYIIFPALLWLIYRLKKSWHFPIFCLLTAVSLATAQWYLGKDTDAVFYLYPFRTWEMFIGVCLATRKLPQVTLTKTSTLMAAVGLAMIILPTFIYDKNTPFPGLTALIPCLGTCLLIHSGNQSASILHRLLSHPIPVFIGKISYSLYLWHWPVFVLFMYIKTYEQPTFVDVIIMSAVTFAASVASWKYIETPFREGKAIFAQKPQGVFGFTIVVSIMLVTIGFVFHKTDGLPARFSGDTRLFVTAANDLFGDFDNCYGEDNSTLKDIGYCAINDPFNAKNYTLIWADSHGAAYKSGLKQAIEGKHSALIVWSGGCPPVFGIDKDESVSSPKIDAMCATRNRAVEKLLKSDTRINAVVLIGRWSYYLNSGGIGVDKNNKITLWHEGGAKGDVAQQDKFFVNAFEKTIEKLNQQGHLVFVVEQAPEFSRFKARTVAFGLVLGGTIDQYEALTTEDYQVVQSRQGKLQEAIKNASADGKITILKTHDFFCNAGQCSLMLSGEPMYFDNNHLSATGSKRIKSMFDPLVMFLNTESDKQ
jgi:peptidoglycan/LPS O-acetylase OafA/YrhL